MKKSIWMQKIKAAGLGAAAAVVTTASVASAEIVTTGWAVDMAPVEAIVALAIPALLVMFGIRKATKTTNRM